MIRIVLIAVAVAACGYLLIRIAKDLREANLDWRGVAIALCLVALALYLRQVTDIGGLV